MTVAQAPLILCCEDEPQLLRDITDELREAGYRVVGALNGVELLAQLEHCNPDLLLCDIMMPEADGYAVLAGFRRDYPHLAHVPLIFLSALSMTEAVIRGKRAGADDYLTKPIDYDLLLSTIEARLRQSVQARRAMTPVARIGQHLLDTLAVGVLAFDAQGALTHANPAARRMLQMHSAANRRAALALLAEPVRRMAGQSRAGVEDSIALMLDEDQARMAQVHACAQDDTLGSAPAVIVYVTDQSSRTPLSAQALGTVFGLTPTEAQVARLLANGQRPEEIATTMGVAPTTIAFHLRNTFSKTATRRQAELVALLLALPLRETG